MTGTSHTQPLSGLRLLTTCPQTSEIYVESKPGIFAMTNLVEAQVSFAIIRVARQEYAFVPKLRAICLLDRIVEMVSFIWCY